MKIRILKEAKIIKSEKDFNYNIGKELGTGRFGAVYEATDDHGNEYAIKVISNQNGNGDRELLNYRLVELAAGVSPIVAKHFPRTFATFNDEAKKLVYIVMEKLTNKGAKAFRIGDLFPGKEASLRTRPDEDIYPDVGKTLRRKLYELLKNDSSRNAGIRYILFGDRMKGGLSAEEEVLFSNIKSELAIVSYLSHPSIEDLKGRLHKDLMDRVTSIGDYDSMSILVDESFSALKQEYLELPGALIFLFKILNLVGGVIETNRLVERFVFLVRRKVPMGIHGNSGTRPRDRDWYGLDPKASDEAFSEIASIRQAIKKLESLTRLVARDMHDENVMVRESTGDLVIVDVGIFTTRDKLKESIKIKLVEKKKRKKRKKSRKKRKPKANYWWGNGLHGTDYGGSDGDGGGGDGKRDDNLCKPCKPSTIKVKIKKNLDNKNSE